MDIVLDFERPILELHRRIAQLRSLEGDQGVNLSASIEQLEQQARRPELAGRVSFRGLLGAAELSSAGSA